MFLLEVKDTVFLIVTTGVVVFGETINMLKHISREIIVFKQLKNIIFSDFE